MKTVIWTSPILHSAEYFTLSQQNNGYQLTGTINLLLDAQPAQVAYHIYCDLNWVTHRVEVHQRRPTGQNHLRLTVDDMLNWSSEHTPLTWASGLTDIDPSITPSTNMLPIHRQDLRIGESRDVNCVWVQLPGLTLSTLSQRYTRIDSQRYHYAAPSLEFEAMLALDEDGIITSYGNLWGRPEMTRSQL